MQRPLRTILLVEDDPDIQEIARLSLETFGGFTVALCSSGGEAVEKAPAIRPDLILLDFMMPGMDGAETLAALRARESLADVPVVFMSAKARPDEVRGFKQLGAVDVITKPFDAVALSDRVRAIWDGLHAG
ncbi:response regulator [Azospirillum sp. sgz302134]